MAYIINLVYFATGWPLVVILCGLYVISVIFLVPYIVFVEPPALSSEIQLPDMPRNAQQKEDFADISDATEPTETNVRIEDPNVHNMQIPPHSVRYYTSLLAPMWVSATLCMSFMYYYMATQMEQLNYLSNNGNIAPLQTAFSVLLPLWGFISNFPLSVLLAKRSSIWLAWSVLAFGAISWTVCSVIPVLNLQCVHPQSFSLIF